MNKIRKLLLCILNSIIGSFLVVGWAACYGPDIPEVTFEKRGIHLSGKVIQKGTSNSAIEGLKVADAYQQFFGYTDINGFFDINSTISTISGSISGTFNILAEDIDGTANGGFFLKNIVSIPLQYDGTSYYQNNIIIEMEKGIHQRLSGKVVQKGNTTEGLDYIRIFDNNNMFKNANIIVYSNYLGNWEISDYFASMINYVIAEDVNGTYDGLYITNSSSVTMQLDSTGYYQENIIIEMEKSGK